MAQGGYRPPPQLFIGGRQPHEPARLPPSELAVAVNDPPFSSRASVLLGILAIWAIPAVVPLQPVPRFISETIEVVDAPPPISRAWLDVVLQSWEQPPPLPYQHPPADVDQYGYGEDGGFILNGSRICNSSRVALAAIDANFTLANKTDPIIFAIGAQTLLNARWRPGDATNFHQFWWRRVGGTFATLGATGELNNNGATVLVNATSLTDANRRGTLGGTFVVAALEFENITGTQQPSAEVRDTGTRLNVEAQTAINLTGALDSQQYEIMLRFDYIGPAVAQVIAVAKFTTPAAAAEKPVKTNLVFYSTIRQWDTPARLPGPDPYVQRKLAPELIAVAVNDPPFSSRRGPAAAWYAAAPEVRQAGIKLVQEAAAAVDGIPFTRQALQTWPTADYRVTTRQLAPELLASIAVDDPPFGSRRPIWFGVEAVWPQQKRASTVAFEAVVVAAAQPVFVSQPHIVASWHVPALHSPQARKLPASLIAVQVDDPPIGARRQGWLGVEPPWPQQRLATTVAFEVIAAPADNPPFNARRPNWLGVEAIWHQQRRASAVAFDAVVVADNPPFVRPQRDWPVAYVHPAQQRELLPPSLLDIAVNDPPFDSRRSWLNAQLHSSWLPGPPQPQVAGKLTPPIEGGAGVVEVVEVRKPKDNRRTRTPLYISPQEQEDERVKLAALKAAQEALDLIASAEKDGKARARRAKVKAVFDKIRLADAYYAEIQDAEAKALQAAAETQKAQRASSYADASATIAAEIGRITQELQTLAARRRQEEAFIFELLLAT